MGYSPRGRQELGMTEQLTHTHTLTVRCPSFPSQSCHMSPPIPKLATDLPPHTHTHTHTHTTAYPGNQSSDPLLASRPAPSLSLLPHPVSPLEECSPQPLPISCSVGSTSPPSFSLLTPPMSPFKELCLSALRGKLRGRKTQPRWGGNSTGRKTTEFCLAAFGPEAGFQTGFSMILPRI